MSLNRPKWIVMNGITRWAMFFPLDDGYLYIEMKTQDCIITPVDWTQQKISQVLVKFVIYMYMCVCSLDLGSFLLKAMNSRLWADIFVDSCSWNTIR